MSDGAIKCNTCGGRLERTSSYGEFEYTCPTCASAHAPTETLEREIAPPPAEEPVGIRELWARLYCKSIFTNDLHGLLYKRYVKLPTEEFDKFDLELKVAIEREKANARLKEAEGFPHENDCSRYQLSGDVENPPCDCWRGERIAALRAAARGERQ
jgi:hypothetical protein